MSQNWWRGCFQDVRLYVFCAWKKKITKIIEDQFLMKIHWKKSRSQPWGRRRSKIPMNIIHPYEDKDENELKSIWALRSFVHHHRTVQRLDEIQYLEWPSFKIQWVVLIALAKFQRNFFLLLILWVRLSAPSWSRNFFLPQPQIVSGPESGI